MTKSIMRENYNYPDAYEMFEWLHYKNKLV